MSTSEVIELPHWDYGVFLSGYEDFDYAIISVLLLTAEWRGCVCGEESFCLAEPQQGIFPLCDVITWIWVKQLRQVYNCKTVHQLET